MSGFWIDSNAYHQVPHFTRSLKLYTRSTNTTIRCDDSSTCATLIIFSPWAWCGISVFRRLSKKYAFDWSLTCILQQPCSDFHALLCAYASITFPEISKPKGRQISNVRNRTTIVCIPSSFNYLILYWDILKGKHTARNLLIGLIEFLRSFEILYYLPQ